MSEQNMSINECLDAGLLTSYRDNELSPYERANVEEHLAHCPDCAARVKGVALGGNEVYGLLDMLSPAAEAMPDSARALAHFQSSLQTPEADEEPAMPQLALVQSRSLEPKQSKRLFQSKRARSRYSWVAVAVAVALIAILLVPNASALASQFLALFTVQQFQPVSVDPQTFSEDFISNLQGFGDVTIPNHEGTTEDQVTQAQAQKTLSFPLALPEHLPSGVNSTAHFHLLNGEQGTFTFNSKKAKAYLQQTGQGNVHIPAQLDGASFTITSKAGAIINYTNACMTSAITHQDAKSVKQCANETQLYVAEIPSPVVQSKGSATLQDLRSFLLSLPKLSPEMRNILQNLDVNKGIVPLPIPSVLQAQKVTINGASGVLVSDSSLKVNGNTLKLAGVIWQSNTILYMVGGSGVDGNAVVDAANSIH